MYTTPILRIQLQPPPSLIYPLKSRKENLSPFSAQADAEKQPCYPSLQAYYNQLQGLYTLEGKPTRSNKQDIGYMLQQDYLFPWKTIEENILLGLKLNKLLNKEKRDYTLNLLGKMGLKGVESQYPKQLSGGMRQRVALVRTLATEPKLLMLDEPFSALDYQTKLHLENLVFETLKSFHKTAILVTHDIGEAIAMSDRIFLFSAKPGKIHKTFSFQKNYESFHHLKQETMNYFKPYFKRYGRSWNLLKPSDNITQLHQQYISSQKREKRWVRFYQLIIFIVFFSSWELASQQQWIDPLIFSSPTRIGTLLIDKVLDGTLLVNLSITLSETIFGFILGTLHWNITRCDSMVVSNSFQNFGSLSRYLKCNAKNSIRAYLNCCPWTKLYFYYGDGRYDFNHYHDHCCLYSIS